MLVIDAKYCCKYITANTDIQSDVSFLLKVFVFTTIENQEKVRRSES